MLAHTPSASLLTTMRLVFSSLFSFVSSWSSRVAIPLPSARQRRRRPVIRVGLPLEGIRIVCGRPPKRRRHPRLLWRVPWRRHPSTSHHHRLVAKRRRGPGHAWRLWRVSWRRWLWRLPRRREATTTISASSRLLHHHHRHPGLRLLWSSRVAGGRVAGRWGHTAIRWWLLREAILLRRVGHTTA